METQTWRDEQRKLREAVRARRSAPPPERPAPAALEVPLLRVHPPDLLGAPIASRGGAPGRAIAAVKQLLRKLLAPFVLEPQATFNQAVVAALYEQRDLLAALAARPVSHDAAAVTDAPLDYLAFEERFRGSSEAIESRQAEYLDFLSERGEVLDIGCGRGELLAMLQARGVSARGVDANEDMVARCSEQGLAAECDDAIDYLERRPDGFFGAVFMGQVVEHLTTDYLVALLDAIGRKTGKDAVLIVEAINPESLPVLMRWFWLDPTHVRLVHPETMQYFMEQAGFGVKTVQFRHEVPPEERLPHLQLEGAQGDGLASFNESVDALNARLFGSLDYFVVGQSEA